MLCDLLHKLPSEIDAEPEENVLHLLIYFNAKNIHEREQQEIAKAEAEMNRGGY